MSVVILKTENLCKKYKHQVVLDSISLQINKGDIYGLIGENGAGKTTFLRSIAGLIYTDSGEISLFSNLDSKKELGRVGFVIESPFLYLGNTAKENLTIYCKLQNISLNRVSELLELVGLSGSGTKKVKNFSLGMKQRLSIAIALISIPEFLVLDEPLNGLDHSGIVDLRKLILKLNREYGVTLLVSSHILKELEEYVSICGIINRGRLIDEFEINELESYITLTVDDVEKAQNILSKKFELSNFDIINNNSLKFNNQGHCPSEINASIFLEGLKLFSSSIEKKSLEEIYRESLRRDSLHINAIGIEK